MEGPCRLRGQKPLALQLQLLQSQQMFPPQQGLPDNLRARISGSAICLAPRTVIGVLLPAVCTTIPAELPDGLASPQLALIEFPSSP